MEKKRWHSILTSYEIISYSVGRYRSSHIKRSFTLLPLHEQDGELKQSDGQSP